MGGFRLAVGRVSLVHTASYCQHSKFWDSKTSRDLTEQQCARPENALQWSWRIRSSHPVLLSAQIPGGAEQESRGAGGGRRGAPCGLNLLHALELPSDCRTLTVHTLCSTPVSTRRIRSARIAANARLVAWICFTPLRLTSENAALSPPRFSLPQVTHGVVVLQNRSKCQHEWTEAIYM